MTPVTADNASPDTPTLYEISPNSAQEQIIEVEVSKEGSTPVSTVLTPSSELTEQTPTLPGGQEKAVVIDLGKLMYSLVRLFIEE